MMQGQLTNKRVWHPGEQATCGACKFHHTKVIRNPGQPKTYGWYCEDCPTTNSEQFFYRSQARSNGLRHELAARQ